MPDQPNQEPERKYALTKLAAGDYLLPSNDAKTIWRIREYTDLIPAKDGHGDEEIDYWGLWRWIGRGTQVDLYHENDDWDFYDGCYTRRHEAIRAALRVEVPR